MGFFWESIRSPDPWPLSNEVEEHFSILKCPTPGSGSWPEQHSWHSSSLLSLPTTSVEPVVTQAGSRHDNFAVHESHGLGVFPSTHYTDQNNVHQRLDQGPRAATFLFSTCVLCILQHSEKASCSWQPKAAKELTPFLLGEGGRWSQIPAGSERARKCQQYLMEWQGSDKLQIQCF